MSLPDGAEYWWDVKASRNRPFGAVHFRPLDKANAACGWSGGGTTPNRDKVNCKECLDREVKTQ